MCYLAVCILVCLVGTSASSNYWVNSTVGTHRFLTFDSHLTPADIAKLPQIDYVWGSSLHNIAAWRNSSVNKNVVLTKYVPYSRDSLHPLSWWKKNYPSWIAYRCDRKTPAHMFGDDITPLDITNPDFVSYQIENYAKPAAAAGYDGIAADNYGFGNSGRACGIWKTPTEWVQKWTGEGNDANWTNAALSWIQNFYHKLRDGKPRLLLIPNYSLDKAPWDSVNNRIVGNYSDGCLSERGFTAWGQGFVEEKEWWDEIHWMENLQRHPFNKGYYSINEWGKSRTSIPAHVREWAVASYLMGKQEHSAVYISSVQGYGYYYDWKELFARVGVAEELAAQHSNGMATRKYSTGLILVNPTSGSLSWRLESAYRAVNGSTFGPGQVMMSAQTGLILLN